MLKEQYLVNAITSSIGNKEEAASVVDDLSLFWEIVDIRIKLKLGAIILHSIENGGLKNLEEIVLWGKLFTLPIRGLSKNKEKSMGKNGLKSEKDIYNAVEAAIEGEKDVKEVVNDLLDVWRELDTSLWHKIQDQVIEALMKGKLSDSENWVSWSKLFSDIKPKER